MRREGAGDGAALVWELVAEVEARIRDAPVAVAAWGALLVELEVAPVAGIADLAGPHLLRRERVSREDADLLAARRANRVDAVGCRAALRQIDQTPVGRDEPAARDEMRLHEEVFQAARGEEVLEAAPILDVSVRGRGPRASRPVRALGKPDAARVTPEVAPVRRKAGVELTVDRAIVRKKRQEPVRGGGGDHLERATLGESAEGRGEVARAAGEVRAQAAVEGRPEGGHGLRRGVAAGGEALSVLACRARALREIGVESRGEPRVRELFREHGGHPDRGLEGNPGLEQPLGRDEERQVRTGHGLV